MSAGENLAMSIPFVAPVKRLGNAVRLTEEAGVGFRSFSAFKRAFGAAGEGMEWHHIVTQQKSNIAKFGAEALHNTKNLVRIEAKVHRRISGYYNSIRDFSDGVRVREWIGRKSFQEQYDFGIDVMKKFGL